MWRCKHCKNEFDFECVSDKANHSRWCESNPKRETWNKSQGTVNRYGEKKKFVVQCSSCNDEFNVVEREKIFPSKDRYYCSKKCATSVGGKAKNLKHFPDEVASYQTVARRHHERKCIVCGHDRILEVHHIDENHDNNDPKNLAYLCPTHHQEFHSRYRKDVEPKILEYQRLRWFSSVGRAPVL